ncbi:citrulline utilization hydrolase CtlX [Nigerium massiliense]|uniref:citrulline utilization hydrolase CtlX n=1 Tax=Nigerium massiliense TaxID=1522317 RepID=UPI000693AC29|nr:arginine deiminase-related protein [Nigerium massiliense]
MKLNHQAPNAVVMVRPHYFTPNPETAADNVFQLPRPEVTADTLAARALAEFDGAVRRLMEAGVRVHVFDDLGRDTPDSVFPNNWVSTHHGGRVAIYPMAAPSRRGERRADIIELLKREYRVQEVIDYSGLENDRLFLEGTGAMVLDHLERVAYVGASNRADPLILERFCTSFGYEPMVFANVDPAGKPIYHTNVIMSIATEFAIVCTEVMSDAHRRDEIIARLRDSGRDIIDISWDQVNEFAGNALEVSGTDRRYLALSTRAAAAFTDDQRAAMERSAELLPLPVPTIELSGGSVRCMLAGVHLSRRGAGDPTPADLSSARPAPAA